MKKKVHTLFNYLANPRHTIYISVIGVGGTGSHVLSGLAQISHALIQLDRIPLHVTAYDDDIVDSTNPGRQLFSPADIDRHKSIVLVERINRFYGFNWDAVPEKFSAKSAGESSNIYISCVDSIKSRLSIDFAIKELDSQNNPYYRYSYYWMDIGNERNHGQIIMGSLVDQSITHGEEDPIRLKTFFDMYPNPVEENIGESCSAHMRYNKQDLFINKTMATFATKLLWELLTRYYIDCNGYFINLDRFSITKIPIKNEKTIRRNKKST